MVIAIVEGAFFKAQTAATDTSVKLVTRCLQCRNSGLDPIADGAADCPPIACAWGSPMRQVTHDFVYFIKRQAKLLRDENKTQPSYIGPGKSALIAACADGFDKPPILVKTDCGYRNPGPPGDIANRQEVF